MQIFGEPVAGPKRVFPTDTSTPKCNACQWIAVDWARESLEESVGSSFSVLGARSVQLTVHTKGVDWTTSPYSAGRSGGLFGEFAHLLALGGLGRYHACTRLPRRWFSTNTGFSTPLFTARKASQQKHQNDAFTDSFAKHSAQPFCILAVTTYFLQRPPTHGQINPAKTGTSPSPPPPLFRQSKAMYPASAPQVRRPQKPSCTEHALGR